MIEKASEKYKSIKNIEFINENVLDLKFNLNSLDIISTTCYFWRRRRKEDKLL